MNIPTKGVIIRFLYRDNGEKVRRYLWKERMIVTVLIFPKFDVAVAGQGAEAAVKLFATAFGFGVGWHAIVDEVAKWAGAFKDVEKKE